ncbi:LicD family protein [Streptococcus pneumoniae]
MTDLQQKLLAILAYFHDFCQKENLRYYVIGGTFLGAVRHQGFIPWDDDIDVAMPRADYERLMSLFAKRQQKEQRYLLETIDSDAPDFLYMCAKLYDTETTLTELRKIPCRRGIFLDIFPLDGLGDSLAEARSRFTKIDRWHMFLATRFCAVESRRKWYKNIAILLANLIPSAIVNNKELARKVDRLSRAKDFDSSSYVCNCFSTYRKREIMPKTLLGKPTPYQFEGIIVQGPEHADAYLSHIFGDWKTLPPKEKQVSHHQFMEFDLNKSWLAGK